MKYVKIFIVMIILFFYQSLIGQNLPQTNQEIVRASEKYFDGQVVGSCRQFVGKVLRDIQLDIGAGYKNVYLQHGFEVSSEQVLPGDIMQITNDKNPENYVYGYHSAIILKNNNSKNFYVAHANWCDQTNPCKSVSRDIVNFFDWAEKISKKENYELTVHFYRMEKIKEKDRKILFNIAYEKYQSLIGEPYDYPYDDYHGTGVHNWNGIWLQDFKNGNQIYHLVLNENQQQVHLIFGGFAEYWFANYKTIGLPTSREFKYGLGARQNFDKAWLEWNGKIVIAHFDENEDGYGGGEDPDPGSPIVDEQPAGFPVDLNWNKFVRRNNSKNLSKDNFVAYTYHYFPRSSWIMIQVIAQTTGHVDKVFPALTCRIGERSNPFTVNTYKKYKTFTLYQYVNAGKRNVDVCLAPATRVKGFKVKVKKIELTYVQDEPQHDPLFYSLAPLPHLLPENNPVDNPKDDKLSGSLSRNGNVVIVKGNFFEKYRFIHYKSNNKKKKIYTCKIEPGDKLDLPNGYIFINFSKEKNNGSSWHWPGKDNVQLNLNGQFEWSNGWYKFKEKTDQTEKDPPEDESPPEDNDPPDQPPQNKTGKISFNPENSQLSFNGEMFDYYSHLVMYGNDNPLTWKNISNGSNIILPAGCNQINVCLSKNGSDWFYPNRDGCQISTSSNLKWNNGSFYIQTANAKILSADIEQTSADVLQENNLPTKFQFKNYPNPFNPETTIEYSLPSSAHVIITIYDIRGRRIKELVNEFQNVGKHSTQFRAENLPSGVYYYQLTAGDYTGTKRMLLIK